METKEKETVFVGLSGGVDSSVSAARLLRAGYRVVGVFIRTWAPDFLPCTIEEDRLDAMRVAAKLNIPFRTFDAEDVYKRDVADYMIAEYRAGRTPNPDVMCNRFVKFGAFLDYALEEGADFIATGHYARVEHRSDGYRLLRGADPLKDQSYFLWTLTKRELERTLFPIGDSVKSTIRLEAARYSLPTADKSDSQGICFLGEVDLRAFLRHYVETEPGDVLDEQGNVVGRHEGALFYTLGQRHGFTLTTPSDGTPRYVVRKNMEKNTVTVASDVLKIQGKRLRVEGVNVIGSTIPPTCTAQFRYRQKPFSVAVVPADGRGMLIDVHDETVELPALGQSAVFYDGDVCLGGGTISEILQCG